ncbi:MAG: hypothetical protein ACTHMU_07595, partial [Thermomicrobiales bacterium]
GIYISTFSVWRQWDACWYGQIAVAGYLPDNPSVAYLPLYPVLMRLASIPLAGNLTLAGLLISSLAYIAAVVGLYVLVCYDFDCTIARRSILYLSLFPSAFYLFMPYTEALFLALTIWALYAARQGKWLWVALGALLASLTRTQGCLLVIPIAWEIVCHRGRASNSGRHWQAALALIAPIAGELAFLVYSKVTTGWTMLSAQSAQWGATYQPPWLLLWHSWQTIIAAGSIIETLNLTLLILFAALALVGLRYLPLSYNLYVAPQIALLTIRQMAFTPLASATRYLLVLFPVFIVLALVCHNRWCHRLYCVTSVMLMIVMVYLFLLGAFVA